LKYKIENKNVITKMEYSLYVGKDNK